MENLFNLIILVNLVKSYDDTDTLPGSCPLRKYIVEIRDQQTTKKQGKIELLSKCKLEG